MSKRQQRDAKNGCAATESKTRSQRLTKTLRRKAKKRKRRRSPASTMSPNMSSARSRRTTDATWASPMQRRGQWQRNRQWQRSPLCRHGRRGKAEIADSRTKSSSEEHSDSRDKTKDNAGSAGNAIGVASVGTAKRTAARNSAASRGQQDKGAEPRTKRSATTPGTTL